ncbi:MAG: hypothetical protein FWC29_05405 [Methanomassiliicoccaceae archaeon]|nr:hypothetical protein [Methanomassiliicoccaceae archaeon]
MNEQAPRYNQNQNAPYYQQKDTGITLLLGVLLGLFGIMGIGQIYVGKAARGIVILLGGFGIVALSYVVFISYLILGVSWVGEGDDGTFLGGLIVVAIVVIIIHFSYFIWQAFDAHKLAKKYNEELYRTGRPPW